MKDVLKSENKQGKKTYLFFGMFICFKLELCHFQVALGLSCLACGFFAQTISWVYQACTPVTVQIKIRSRDGQQQWLWARSLAGELTLSSIFISFHRPVVFVLCHISSADVVNIYTSISSKDYTNMET